jgi:O-acetyl-ADP-ribose deacetylase (regulator of RNase III)
MKIEKKTGSLLDIPSGHIVHGCNAQGVMGSGVAKAIKDKWPHVYQDYRDIFEKKGLTVGDVYPVRAEEGILVWNAITQEYFGTDRRHVSYDAIENCFKLIQQSLECDWYASFKKEIHIPLIGCGLGGGNWEIVREIIEQTVTVPVTLWIQ